jgi:hypothetical protein
MTLRRVAAMPLGPFSNQASAIPCAPEAFYLGPEFKRIDSLMVVRRRSFIPGKRKKGYLCKEVPWNQADGRRASLQILDSRGLLCRI